MIFSTLAIFQVLPSIFRIFPPFSVFLAIFQVIQCLCLNFHLIQYSSQWVFIIFHVFECFSPYFTFYIVCFSFSNFFLFLPIFQVLQCAFLIFHLFQCFSKYSKFYSVCFSFSMNFSILAILQVFSMNLSFFMFFRVSRHISHPRVCVSHFPKLSISRHIPGPTVCISHFPTFSVFLSIIQDLQCVSLIFHVFQCYLPYFTSYSVHFSFSTLFSVPRHFPGQTMFVSHFSRFYFFSQYSMSYSVHFSFSTFFSVS